MAAFIVIRSLPAIGLHAATHALGWMHLHAPDLHFFAALSLVGLGMVTYGLATAAVVHFSNWGARR